MRIKTAAIATTLTGLLSASAGAFAPTPKGERSLETASSVTRPARNARTPIATAPASAQAALERIKTAGLGRVLWDHDTGAATQLFGAGIAAPGANTSANAAEQAARSFLDAHLGVLAPGATVADFELVSNVVRGELRAVGFAQHAGGIPVLGGQIGFVFKHDRLIIVNSTALPDVQVNTAAAAFRPDLVRAGAHAWITSVTGADADATDITERVVLPIVHARTAAGPDVEYRVVYPVKVALTGGAIGAWDVYVDAATNAPIARHSTMEFATGTVMYAVPDRYPGSTRSNHAAPNTVHTVNGTAATSNGLGVVTWAGGAASTVNPGLAGPRVRMHNDAGAIATTSLTLSAGGQVVWDESANEMKDAQLTSFIHASLVKSYVKTNIAPDLTWLDGQIDVYVNEASTCNAYSNGDDIHFFQSGGGCENTGRIADVVYHEFGHSVHGNAIIPGVGDFDGSVSEGVSDFLAATITDDHGMGRGFFQGSSEPLRDLDPVDQELVYPADVTGEVHADGEIIAEALWDLRKATIAALGPDEGKALAEKIWFHILEISVDLPSTYAAALAADDDDGNLDNGTPHECVIEGAFALHGLAPSATTMLGVGTPVVDGLSITVPVAAPPVGARCPPPTIEAGTLEWKVRGDGGGTTSIALVEADAGGGATEWSATLPAQPDDTVVNYKIALQLSNGNTLDYPNNRADSLYEMYVGPTEEIWCEDFETGATEWVHGAEAGGTDEWAAGAPQGLGGDPTEAFEGTGVFGIDLTTNGNYRPDTTQWARSPVIDVTGKEGVRLQYRRWLGVEDGFFDAASIVVDGNVRWSNLNSMQGNGSNVSHVDKEWRFQDVDLAADAADGNVQLEFRLESDPGLQFGGWTLDHVCIVARGAAVGGVCGDGAVDAAEQCDDGNVVDGDGCSAACVDETVDPGEDGGCCSTGSSPGGPMLLGLMTLGLVIRRRRGLRV